MHFIFLQTQWLEGLPTVLLTSIFHITSNGQIVGSLLAPYILKELPM